MVVRSVESNSRILTPPQFTRCKSFSKRELESGDRWIHFFRLPQPSPLHPARYHEHLSRDVTSEFIRGKEHGCARDVLGPSELGQRHGSRDLAHGLRVCELGRKSWHHGPARTNAIDA